MANYAIVSNGVVENVIVWDGETPFSGSEGLIDLASNPEVGPGYTYNGTTFAPPTNQVSETSPA
jgi:hypothetical protein